MISYKLTQLENAKLVDQWIVSDLYYQSWSDWVIKTYPGVDWVLNVQSLCPEIVFLEEKYLTWFILKIHE